MSVGLPQMPATMPWFCFAHPDDDNYVRLRGGDVFRAFREYGFHVVLSSDHDHAVSPSVPVRALAAVDGKESYVDTLLTFAENPASCVLVDVCGPIWEPKHLMGPDDSRRYWSEPQKQAEGQRLLEGADGITTPHPAYVDKLLEYNDNVFVLSDLVLSGDEEADSAALVEFTRTLTLAWHTSHVAKSRRWATPREG